MTAHIRKTGEYIVYIPERNPISLRLLDGTEVDILQTTRSVCLCSLAYADHALAMIENDNLDRRAQQLIIRSTNISVSLNKVLTNNDAEHGKHNLFRQPRAVSLLFRRT
jgi:hypothetical protein